MPFTAALLLVAAQQASAQAPPDMPGITRTNLQQEDLSIPGRVIVQTRVDFAPGAVVPKNLHTGEEIVYVLTGTL